MSKNKKSFQIVFLILGIILVILLICYGILRASANSFNSTLRSDHTEDGLTILITPRGGSTDSWTKGMSDGSTLTGTIYDLSAANTGSYEISDWTERVAFQDDCYINNGWCGTFEIHQFRNGKETAQTVDLRDYKESEITLDHIMEGQDLMISLHSGDYIVYHPSAEVYEMPLSVSASTSAGLILYYGEKAPDLSDTEANFHYHVNFTEFKPYEVLLAAFALWAIALIVAVSLYLFSRTTEKELKKREKNLEESIEVFSGFVDAKDSYTNGHARRVAEYAEKLAKAMGYTEQQCRNVYYIGLMHDCGKCYVPDEILKKPGKLTDEEYNVIKSHTSRGAELLKDFTSLENIKEGALYHHERYDGRGYPCGVSGKEIPEIGRILCIADAFDAMNSKRVYRNPLTKEQILKELQNGKGTQFDPDLLEVFLKLINQGEIEFDQDLN